MLAEPASKQSKLEILFLSKLKEESEYDLEQYKKELDE